MKGTYDDGTEFFLSVYYGSGNPESYKEEFNENSIKVNYSSIDGMEIQTVIDYLKSIESLKKSASPQNLIIGLYGERKITYTLNSSEKEESKSIKVDNSNRKKNPFIACLTDSEYYDDKSMPIEKALAIGIEDMWSQLKSDEKKTALCFLERYLLTFENTRYFAQTGKLNLVAFDEIYGTRNPR